MVYVLCTGFFTYTIPFAVAADFGKPAGGDYFTLRPPFQLCPREDVSAADTAQRGYCFVVAADLFGCQTGSVRVIRTAPAYAVGT